MLWGRKIVSNDSSSSSILGCSFQKLVSIMLQCSTTTLSFPVGSSWVQKQKVKVNTHSISLICNRSQKQWHLCCKWTYVPSVASEYEEYRWDQEQFRWKHAHYGVNYHINDKNQKTLVKVLYLCCLYSRQNFFEHTVYYPYGGRSLKLKDTGLIYNIIKNNIKYFKQT